MGMYPPEWWWAERQVSEVLAENPGELVKTGTTGAFKIFNAILETRDCAGKYLILYLSSCRFAKCSLHSASKPLEVEQDPSLCLQSDCVE